jgi:hypothetical protein
VLGLNSVENMPIHIIIYHYYYYYFILFFAEHAKQEEPCKRQKDKLENAPDICLFVGEEACPMILTHNLSQ